MIINGANLILGRLAVYVAKKALEGETITILNCEKVVITGGRKFLLNKFKERVDRGHPYHGPLFPKQPDRIVKRAIRGMLPYHKGRGRNALKHIKCFIGVPEQFNLEKADTIEGADISKLQNLNFVYVNDLSKSVGKGIIYHG